jgi:DNA-binding transcriptional regulator YiaG
MTGTQESRAVPNFSAFELREVAVDTRRVTLGEDIRTARERLRMNQLELAEAVGVSESTVSNWERGRSSPKNRLGLVREVLKLDATAGATDEADDNGATDEELVLRSVSDSALLAEVARRFSRGLGTQAARRGRGDRGTLPAHLADGQSVVRRVSDG